MFRKRCVTLMEIPEANEYINDPEYMGVCQIYWSPSCIPVNGSITYSMAPLPANVIVFRYLIWLINGVKEIWKLDSATRAGASP